MFRGPAMVFVVLVGVWMLMPRFAHADVLNMPNGEGSVQFVAVGSPNEPPDRATDSLDGSVGYTCQTGSYDATVGQYCEFLNVVAATDTYGLYNSDMGGADNSFTTVGITQSGSPGSYTDSTMSGDAGATYFLPSEDEWYKAAYFNPGNSTYWTYPTQSDSTPGDVLSASGTDNADFAINSIRPWTDPMNYLAQVGALAGTPSPFGTFGVGGDPEQWTDAISEASTNRISGAHFWDNLFSGLARSARYTGDPQVEINNIGFRVAGIPEPGSVTVDTRSRCRLDPSERPLLDLCLR